MYFCHYVHIETKRGSVGVVVGAVALAAVATAPLGLQGVGLKEETFYNRSWSSLSAAERLIVQESIPDTASLPLFS